VFYPTLGGKLAREGLGRRCSDDSLFTITWRYLPGKEEEAKAYVTPLVRLNYDDHIYYNDGEIDIAPDAKVKNYVSNVSINRGALYMWNDTCIANMKIGPYYLHQGVMASTSDDISAMNTVRTLLKDVPVGYEVADTTRINKIVNFMYKSGEVYAANRLQWNEVPPFFTYKRFIMLDNSSTKYKVFQLNNGKTSVDVMDETVGQALLIRKKDFKFM